MISNGKSPFCTTHWIVAVSPSGILSSPNEKGLIWGGAGLWDENKQQKKVKSLCTVNFQICHVLNNSSHTLHHTGILSCMSWLYRLNVEHTYPLSATNDQDTITRVNTTTVKLPVDFERRFSFEYGAIYCSNIWRIDGLIKVKRKDLRWNWGRSFEKKETKTTKLKTNFNR